MRLAFATPTPEVAAPVPVALFSGSFSQRLQKAARLGYDGVELMVARPADIDAADIRSQVADSGLEIAAIASGAVYMVDKLTLLARSAEVSRDAERRLQELIEFAARVAAPLVTIGGFRGRLAWDGGAPARARLIEQLIVAAGQAESCGVRLVLEPLNRYESDIVNNTSEALSLFDEVDRSHLGLLLDTFHVNIEEPSVTDCFREGMAARKLWHVHLGDSNRLPPGEGHLDFSGIVATLRDIGYQGYLSAELLPRPDPDAAGAATIRHMRSFVPAETRSKVHL
jgi:sugar phosphate isomerase/epimerase